MASDEIPDKMKGMIKKEETSSYVLESMDVPEPEKDEVLIRVDAASICGSDISLYHWNEMAKAIATVPFIPGHEATGTVVKKGPDATLNVGQRIAVENHFFCGECYQCRHDRGDICQRLNQYGHGKGTIHGGCSQYSIVSSKYCYPLKTDISAEAAVLLEPMGVAHNAIEQVEPSGEDVLIIGCGPIGVLACSIAKALGAKRVLAADIDEARLALAKEMGADKDINPVKENIKEVILSETDGNGIGRICEMSGAEPMVNSQFSLLRKGGHVVMVGLPKKPLHVENPLPDIVFKSLCLKTIHGRRIYHSWEECERLVNQGKVNITKVITHRVPMSKFEDAFSALFSGKACKIVLDPQK